MHHTAGRSLHFRTAGQAAARVLCAASGALRGLECHTAREQHVTTCCFLFFLPSSLLASLSLPEANACSRRPHWCDQPFPPLLLGLSLLLACLGPVVLVRQRCQL